MLVPIADFIGRVSDRRSSTALFSLSIFIFFGLLDAGIDRLTLHTNVDPDLHTTIQATIVGLAACVIAVVLLVARRERRRLVREEILRVMELNHRIRNSLQVITYAHCVDPDDAHKAAHRDMILDAVSSMDATLRELFPTLGVERRREGRAVSIDSSPEWQKEYWPRGTD
jgi:hypothetical protein